MHINAKTSPLEAVSFPFFSISFFFTGHEFEQSFRNVLNFPTFIWFLRQYYQYQLDEFALNRETQNIARSL